MSALTDQNHQGVDAPHPWTTTEEVIAQQMFKTFGEPGFDAEGLRLSRFPTTPSKLDHDTVAAAPADFCIAPELIIVTAEELILAKELSLKGLLTILERINEQNPTFEYKTHKKQTTTTRGEARELRLRPIKATNDAHFVRREDVGGDLGLPDEFEPDGLPANVILTRPTDKDQMAMLREVAGAAFPKNIAFGAILPVSDAILGIQAPSKISS